MNKKKIIIGCSISFGVFILVIAGAGIFIYLNYIKPYLDFEPSIMPPELAEAKIIIGAEKITRQIVFQDDRLGVISDLVYKELDSKPGPELGVAASNGAAFLEEDFKVKNVILFSSKASHVDFIDIEYDGICEYISRGSWCNDASLIGHTGNTIWTYGGGSGVDDMAAGDIDHDGIVDFVVGFNGGGGVHRVSIDGEKLWRRKDGNVWHVEVVDTNGDNISEIVHSNAAGQMIVRNSEGEILAKKRLNPYFSDFSICRWPSKNDQQYALLSEDDTIWLFDFKGNSIKQYKAPYCGDLGDARGVPLLGVNGSNNFIVLVNHHNWERSILYWFDSIGDLIYQEIIAEQSAAITSIKVDQSGKEYMLIGGDGKVWKYALKNI